jgi:hypothetical protein
MGRVRQHGFASHIVTTSPESASFLVWPDALGGVHEYCGRLSPLCSSIDVCAGADWYHTGKLHDPGGHRTYTRLIRPVARLEQRSYYPQLVARVVALYDPGYGRAAIAQTLNTEGCAGRAPCP